MRTVCVFAAMVAASVGLAEATPPLPEAIRIFAEARIICERDGGRLWGASICGPVLLADPTDRTVVASAPDAGGKLEPDGAVFRGILPSEVNVANTSTDWSGVRWTQVMSPLPEDRDARRVLIAHEMFHRVQAALGLTRDEVPNQHLDTLEGRYLLQLEWRALTRALESKRASAKRAAIGDALAFRAERYRIFATAAKEEGALELTEGLAEYTGVKLGLETHSDSVRYAVRDLQAFVSAPTFVRSFAYATGPAYGLLLDGAYPAWRTKIREQRFDQLLRAAIGGSRSDSSIASRAKRYDDGSLRSSEVKRDLDRQARLAAFKTKLIDGPVLELPLKNSNYQFNPQTLVPLDGIGTVYPTMRLTDDWGALEVERGGALVWQGMRRATVSAVGATAESRSGDGWQLTLKPGWSIQPGVRKGDLAIVCIASCQ